MNMPLADRCVYLSDISGLNVIIRHDAGRAIYVFLDVDREVSAFWSYKKAKAFARGIAYGRQL